MKHRILPLFIPFFPILALASPSKNLQTLKLDTVHSKASWSAKNFIFCRSGFASFKEGTFQLKHHFPTKGRVVVDLSRFTCRDSEAGRGSKNLNLSKMSKVSTATFDLNSFETMQPFAPGGPNAFARGILRFGSRIEKVEVRMVYTPTRHGFRSTGSLPLEVKKLGLGPGVESLVENPFWVELELIAGTQD